jgi:hypothetical protein
MIIICRTKRTKRTSTLPASILEFKADILREKSLLLESRQRVQAVPNRVTISRDDTYQLETRDTRASLSSRNVKLGMKSLLYNRTNQSPR